ncbi:hypothetical protein Rhopal_003438-T1 [Rhodotorula paludigena]|uniref:Class E vacuolar protein-sorting machinery protein HSE1 n=1 Tax=Rhodotorula paludigena TaxID=86838 RepID=A0AAV5GN14_9BASI|nr:hypothetical protein Rhopal_003438-T1 [Rhodotorula paludigena]
MFGRPANPYDDGVAKATDEKQTEIDWSIVLDLTDKVTADGETGARNCVAAVQKRFTHRSANVQQFALTLAGALVNNCGAAVHREISGKAFTQALTRLINDRTTHETVKKEALKQIETWVKEHPGNTDFDLLVETYESLKRQGHNFNPDRPPTPRTSRTDDALRREEEELQRALAESAALADPLRNYRPSAGRATSPGGGKALPQPVPSPGPHHPQQQQQQPAGRVRGLYDFVGETSDELPFRRGDVIRVLERVSEEWWKGELKGRVGIFPTNYVEELPNEPTHSHHGPSSSLSGVPASSAADPQAAEAEIFAQAAAVDKLLALMHALRARGEDFADNDELTDLYNSSMALRPKVVQLIRKYEQKQADLHAMNEKVDRAKATYEQLAGIPARHPQGYPVTNGYPARQQQPPLDQYGRPYDPHSVAAQQHQPQQQLPPPQHAQSPYPVQQQQQQGQQVDPQRAQEEEAQREYQRKWAEYERQLAEYNAQMAALQQAGVPVGAAPGPAGAQPAQGDPQQQAGSTAAEAQGHAPPAQQQSHGAQHQPVWDAQTGQYVWPQVSATVSAPPPAAGTEGPAPTAQGYPAQTQPYAAPDAHPHAQGYQLADQMAHLSVAGAGSPQPAPAQAYAPVSSPPPPHAGSAQGQAQAPGAYYGLQPAQAQADPYAAQQQPQPQDQAAAWAAWHAQQQQQQSGGGAPYPPGPGSAGTR